MLRTSVSIGILPHPFAPTREPSLACPGRVLPGASLTADSAIAILSLGNDPGAKRAADLYAAALRTRGVSALAEPIERFAQPTSDPDAPQSGNDHTIR